MSETEVQERKAAWYQGYTLSTVDIRGEFRAKYGYEAAEIIITGGGILAGPVEEPAHEKRAD